MKLAFFYQPIEDLAEAGAFYRERLGFEEAWREAEDTVAFWTPDRSMQIMVTTDKTGPVGPMYLVASVDEWIRGHADVVMTVAPLAIPGGSVAGFGAPGGHTFYVFDQPDA